MDGAALRHQLSAAAPGTLEPGTPDGADPLDDSVGASIFSLPLSRAKLRDDSRARAPHVYSRGSEASWFDPLHLDAEQRRLAKTLEAVVGKPLRDTNATIGELSSVVGEMQSRLIELEVFVKRTSDDA